MTIHLRPDLEALLQEQVTLGHYPSVESALEAAVLALRAANAESEGDMAWVKPYLDEAAKDIASGRAHSHKEIWAALQERLGKP